MPVKGVYRVGGLGTAGGACVLLVAGLAACGSSSRTATSSPASTDGLRLPPRHAGFDYQIGGAYPPPPGVRVVSLLPGRILTDRMRHLAQTPEDQERSSESIPLRRFGDPAEFGRAAAYLLSPAASYITGCAVPVDGGLLRVF